jgi:hypothetical protein
VQEQAAAWLRRHDLTTERLNMLVKKGVFGCQHLGQLVEMYIDTWATAAQ